MKHMTTNDMVVLLIFGIVMYVIAIIIKEWNKDVTPPLPKQTIVINITGKRQPSYRDCIEQWILDYGFDFEKIWWQTVRDWNEQAEKKVRKCFFWKKRRWKEFEEKRNLIGSVYYAMFDFRFVKTQTRYRQYRYQRTPYKVTTTQHVEHLSMGDIRRIIKELEAINFEATTEKYYSKNQRRLMTKELRHKIMVRDNYTCQKCGKYMPDEVGLHIDHIIPVKKGGKTVESNLQVLCDKCNLRKSTSIA